MKDLEFIVTLGVIATIIGIADAGCSEKCYHCQGRETGKCDEFCSDQGWCGSTNEHRLTGYRCSGCANVGRIIYNMLFISTCKTRKTVGY